MLKYIIEWIASKNNLIFSIWSSALFVLFYWAIKATDWIQALVFNKIFK